MALTEAQLKEITKKLFLFKDPPPRLPVPDNIDNGTNPAPLVVRMIPVALDERFKKISFGVVEFQADVMKPPSVFLHKADTPWRMGSTGKLAALLAAAQLRDDVQKVAATGFLTKDTEYDDLFSTIWSRHKEQKVRDIGKRYIGEKDGSPRVSTIFDLSKPKPDFKGAPNINKSLSRVDYPDPKTPNVPRDPWREITKISFQDRLWLMGAQSDNASAQSCISEIGLAYMKEVQRAYGLLNPTKGMHMLLGGGFFSDSPTTPVSNTPGAPTYRELRGRDYEKQDVKDEYFDSNEPQRSTQPGSVAALTAYMIALIQEKLVNKDGCDAIKSFMADVLPVTPPNQETLPGSLIQGVQKIPGVTIAKAHGKGGALEKGPTKAERALRCDVAYIETSGSAGKKFAIVAQGLVPFKGFTPEVQGQDLAKAIHAALIAP